MAAPAGPRSAAAISFSSPGCSISTFAGTGASAVAAVYMASGASPSLNRIRTSPALLFVVFLPTKKENIYPEYATQDAKKTLIFVPRSLK